MSLGTDILSAGMDLLGEVMGTKSGTLTQADGTVLAFTGLVEARRARNPRPGQADEEELNAFLPESGISAAPRADARVVFTGGSETWLVLEAQPATSGPIGWRLRLSNYLQREQESE